MADTTLLLGVAGVAGTIAGTATGAIIAAQSTAALDRRREARAHQEEDAMFRGAARLVWLDLAMADGNLAWAALRKRWHPAKVRLPMDAWERHRERLAVRITDPEAWHTVAIGMSALTHLRETTEALWHEQGELPPETVSSIAEVRTLIVAAGDVLRPLADLPPDPL
jgi:hypothetical protein